MELKSTLHTHILQYRAHVAAGSPIGSAPRSPATFRLGSQQIKGSPNTTNAWIASAAAYSSSSSTPAPALLAPPGPSPPPAAHAEHEAARRPAHGGSFMLPPPPMTPGINVQFLPQTPTTPHLPEGPRLSIKLLSIDTQFKYTPVAFDYGPFNLGQVVRFTRGLAGLLRQSGVDAVVCYCQDSATRRINGALLMAAYLLLQLYWPPDSTLQLLDDFCTCVGGRVGARDVNGGRRKQVVVVTRVTCSPPNPCGCVCLTPPGNPMVRHFRDASMVHEQYDLTLHDCIYALNTARGVDIFSINTFNLNEYDYYSNFDNGTSKHAARGLITPAVCGSLFLFVHCPSFFGDRVGL